MTLHRQHLKYKYSDNFLMFGISNPCNDLQYSQRFIYNNFEYYNDYDSPNNFPNDISKIFHNCKRKITPQIYLYKNDKGKHSRRLKSKDSMADQSRTMEALLGTFLQAFYQNNYSYFPDGCLDEHKNRYNVRYYPKEDSIKEMMMSYQLRNKKKANKVSLDLMRLLLDILTEDIKEIMKKEQEGTIEEHKFDYYRFWLALSELSYCELHPGSHSREVTLSQAEGLNEFKILLENILGEVSNAQSWAHLMLCIPNISRISYLFNPVLAGVHSFLRIQESYSKSDSILNEEFVKQIPKIVVVNLDGSQTPLNLQIVDASSATSLFYVSLYHENDPLGKCSIEETEATLAYSELLVKLIGKINKRSEQQKSQRNCNLIYFPKILAFPLSSPYLKKKLQSQGKSSPNISGSSEDIHFLFQNVIYDEIRTFSPSIVVVSYSGKLHISQKHFTSIIRNLSIICDHRIILFPNLCNFLQEESPFLKFSPPNDFTINSQEGDLTTMAKLLETCQEENLEELNLNQFFQNLGMFLKIASGAYSFQKRDQNGSHTMYETGEKYQYLNALAKIPELASYTAKFSSSSIRGSALRKIFHSKRDQFILKNKEGSEFYEQIINQAIRAIFQHSQTLPIYLAYRYERIKSQLSHSQGAISDYLNQRKKSILIRTLKRQKIHKKYIMNPNSQSLKVYSFYMITNDGQKAKLYFDDFTQIIFDPSHRMVFCLNYAKQDGNKVDLLALYGLVGNDQTIQMKVISNAKMSMKNNAYFCYSHCFNKTNRYLYLYWPSQWNLLLQAECLLLNTKYQAKSVHKLSIIEFNIENMSAIWMEMPATQQTLLSKVPKNGSSAWAKTDSEIYIFGGVCNSEDDFAMQSSSGVSIMNITQDYFEVVDIPKQKLGAQMRPKINYIIQEKAENVVVVNRGYGREFTNFYNIYSYVEYTFDANSLTLRTEKVQRQISCLEHPMLTSKTAVTGNTNLPAFAASELQTQKDLQEGSKIATTPTEVKHKFIMESLNGNPSQAVSFVDGDYLQKRYEDPQEQNKHSFGFRKAVTAVLAYTHCSPELYLENQQSQLIRIELLLEIIRKQTIPSSSSSSSLPSSPTFPSSTSSMSMSQKDTIFPNQDSIISICMSDGSMRIYMLACSALYTLGNFVIYQGNLGSQFQNILKKRELVLTPYYIFNDVKKGYLEGKTLLWTDQGLILTGGNLTNNNERIDHLIQKKAKKTSVKQVKLTVTSETDRQDILSIAHGFIFSLQQPQYYQMYGIGYNQNQREWELKIQRFSLNQSVRQISISNLIFCAMVESPSQQEPDRLEQRVYEIIPDFQNPVVSSISKAKLSLGLAQVKNKAQALVILLRKVRKQSRNKNLQVVNNLQNICKFLANSTDAEIVAKQHQLLQSIPNQLRKIHEDRYQVFDVEEVIRIGVECLNAFQYFRTTQICKRVINDWENGDIYQFYIEDRNKPLVKYLAMGSIDSLTLIFFRVRFQSPMVLPFSTVEYKSEEFLGRTLNERGSYAGIGQEKRLKRVFKHSEDTWVSIEQLEPQECNAQIFRVQTQLIYN